jgi:hypothetical protein
MVVTMKVYMAYIFTFLLAPFWALGGSFNDFIAQQDTLADTNYYYNGPVKSITYYTIKEISVKDKATAFALGLKFPYDSVATYKSSLYEDYFEYDSGWNVVRIKRIHSAQPPIFIYGRHHSIGLFTTKLYTTYRTRDTNTIEVPILNLTNRDLSIQVETASPTILNSYLPCIVHAADTSQCSIQIVQPNGFETLNFALVADDARIEIEVTLFGYDVESSDFDQSKPIHANTTNDALIYYRTGNEALLELYDSTGENLIKTFSLAREKTSLDFSDIQPGTYQLRTINFKSNQFKYQEFILARN